MHKVAHKLWTKSVRPVACALRFIGIYRNRLFTEGGMNAQVPIIAYDDSEAANAYAAYVGILTQERLDPSLATNPAWVMIRQAAYAQFYCKFEVIQ